MFTTCVTKFRSKNMYDSRDTPNLPTLIFFKIFCWKNIDKMLVREF